MLGALVVSHLGLMRFLEKILDTGDDILTCEPILEAEH